MLVEEEDEDITEIEQNDFEPRRALRYLTQVQLLVQRLKSLPGWKCM